MLKSCLFAIALAACGGSKKQTAMPETATSTGATDSGPSECDRLAGHVADVVSKSPDAPQGATRDVLVELVATHCSKDDWSADAKKCFGEISDPNGGEVCAKTLTMDQQHKLKDDANERFGKRKKREESKEASDDDADDAAGGKGKPAPAARAPAAAKPPPPPPKSAPPKGGSSKGPVKSNDPDEGGE